MNGIFGKIIKAAILAAVFVFLTGCNYNNQLSVNAVAKEPPVKTAWLTYWDLAAGEKELAKIEKKLDQLSYFGAYFDANDRLFVPQELSAKNSKLKTRDGKYLTYLTFINDKQNADGTVALKDIEVLRRLLADDASLEKHCGEIVALTLQGGYDGIEIDYERIWADRELGRLFLRFVDRLYLKACDNKLRLRVILEPNTPFSSADFSPGPEYVVMLYNLYGLHSTPGPKANAEFIQKTLARMSALPGEKSVAFSTGGCVWGSNGDKRLLTEVDAKTLAMTHGAAVTRDAKSQCLVFNYKDKNISYIAWYADVKTLKYWIAVARENGANSVSLWRLGGNVDIKKI